MTEERMDGVALPRADAALPSEDSHAEEEITTEEEVFDDAEFDVFEDPEDIQPFSLETAMERSAPTSTIPATTSHEEHEDEHYSYYIPKTNEAEFDDVLTETQRIRNQGLRQDINLKRITLSILFIFLAAETYGIFWFTFLQATHTWGFALEEWSFNLLITGTIMQITYMLQVAVKHLFPEKMTK